MAVVRERILFRSLATDPVMYYGAIVPCLSNAHICDAIVFAEGYVDVAEGIEGAVVEADVFSQGFEDKGPLIQRGFGFSRHSFGGNRAGLGGVEGWMSCWSFSMSWRFLI